jgi:hypothetical protein
MDTSEKFPFQVSGCESGRWPWEAINLYDLVSDEDRSFAPAFLAQRLHGNLIFTIR